MRIDNRSDHDILIAVEIRQIELEKHFENHLSHHRRLNYALIGVAGSAFISLSVLVINLLMKMI